MSNAGADKLYHILIVEDDDLFCRKLSLSCKKYFFFERAKSEEEAIEKIKQSKDRKNLNALPFDLILLDLDLKNDLNFDRGIQFIQPFKEKYATIIPIIVITADNRISSIVKSIKAGAKNFLYKGQFDPLFWLNLFTNTIKEAHCQQKDENLVKIVSNINEATNDKHPFISQSKEIAQIKKELRGISKFPNASILILGETGVGKEVAARYLHSNGQRKDRPFVDVNLSAIQPTLLESNLFGHKKGSFTSAINDHVGYFEQANGGVLFLDEIGDIQLDLQVKLLRFFDNKTIRPVGGTKDIELDVQIVTATNKDLDKEVLERRFRDDFYQRIKGYTIKIPPLRSRKKDIFPIIEHYINTMFKQSAIDVLNEEVKEKLINYRWRGNVRELRQTIESVMLKAAILEKDIVSLDCLPDSILEYSQFQQGSTVSPNAPLEVFEGNDLEYSTAQLELNKIEVALIKSKGKKQTAAEMLGVTADQLLYKVKKKYFKTHRHLFTKFPTIRQVYSL